MKLFLAMVSLLVFSIVATGQATNWTWAKSISQNNLSYGYHTTVSRSGEISVVGVFTDSINSGNGNMLYSYGSRDIFVAHYSNSGQLLWAKSAGGRYKDVANGVAEDSKGNIYVTGSFTDTAFFGNVVLNYRDSIPQNATLSGDIFLAKYDKLGNLKWVKRGGSIWQDYGSAIAIDKSDNVFITGVYAHYPSSPAIHGIATFDAQSITAPGTAGMFLARYDTSGNVVWVKSSGGAYTDIPADISLDNSSNIYFTGSMGSPYIYFDNVRLDIVSSLAPGGMFIVKYDSSGNAQWAKGAGGDGITVGYAVINDASNNSYVTGYIESNFTNFGNGYNLPGWTSFDNAYIAKYSPTGNLLWAKNAGVNTDDNNYATGGIVLDKNKNIYITGTFSNDSYFGGDTVHAYGYRDAMVCKYDSSGNPIWFTHAGSTGLDAGNDIAIDTTGNLYVTGVISGPTAQFGAHQLSNNTGQFNMFIAKLGQSPTGILQLPFGKVSASVYPNPSAGNFYVSWDKTVFTTAAITNTLGQLVSTLSIPKGAQAIHISQPDLKDGLYFIRLEGEAGTTSSKVTIRH